jgi:WD40 repeat protein
MEDVSVWDVARRRRLFTISLGAAHAFTSGARHVLAFSPDGQFLAAGATDGAVRVVRVSDGRRVALLTHSRDSVTLALPTGETTHFGSNFPIMSVAFDPRGRWLVSASANGSLLVWSTADWVAHDTLWALDSLRKYQGFLLDAVLADSGRTLAAATWDGTVHFWETRGWRQTGRIERVIRNLSEIAVSPDGSFLTAANSSGQLRVWSRATGVLAPAESIPRTIPHVTFAPSGDSMLVAWRLGSVDVRPTAEPRARSILKLPGMGTVLVFFEVSTVGQHLFTAQSGDPWVYAWPSDQWQTRSGLQRRPVELTYRCEAGAVALLTQRGPVDRRFARVDPPR